MLNLLEETLMHFREGARSVRAYAHEKTYIITKQKESDFYWIVVEEVGFEKISVVSLTDYFKDVFGIEAFY